MMYAKILCLVIWVATGCMWPGGALGWGFFGHERINRLAVFSLPPQMLVFFKPHIAYIVQHATTPDKRRYLVADEGPRHYIDIDRYGDPPFPALPRGWREAVARYGADTLAKHGILPWHLERMQYRLTEAFRQGNGLQALRTAAELGHYIGDAYVPLHASSNHNGQKTDQHGIHGLWESRIPELFADARFDYWTGKAAFVADCRAFFWKAVLESAEASWQVLAIERQLARDYPADRRYAWELRNGKLTRQYSTGYASAYQERLGDMVERRMRGAIAAVAACWYTAWADAGQPPLAHLAALTFPELEVAEDRRLDSIAAAGRIFGREH